MPLRQSLPASGNAAFVYVSSPQPCASFATAAKAWPDAVAFREAIQTPSVSLPDAVLGRCAPVLDKRGLPVAYSGRFAIVFQLRDERTGETWALRCFTSPDASGERAARYESVARYLAEGEGENSPFTPFRFLARGIRVGQAWYPVVAMRWANGTSLGRWIEERREDPNALRRLASALDELLATLEARHLAHGDWQHDNILVAEDGNGQIRLTLVDYDGVYTPELDGLPATELGHPNYQHPRRGGAHFGVGLDRFAHLSLTVALHALALDPELWKRAGHDGESVIFRRTDFENPNASPVFALIHDVAARTGDALLNARLVSLDTALRGEPGDLLMPLGDDVRARASADRSRLWWLGEETERAAPVGEPTARFVALRSQTPLEINVDEIDETKQFPFIAKLQQPATTMGERQHLRGSRTCLGGGLFVGTCFWFPSAATAPNGVFFITLFCFVYALVASLCYFQWPRNRIHDQLYTEYFRTKMRYDTAKERLACSDARLSPAAQNALNSGEATFVHQRLWETRIGDWRTSLWLPGDERSAQRLRAAGIYSLADLHDRLVIPNLSSEDMCALLQTRRDREDEARAEFWQLNAQSACLTEWRAETEAEREKLKAELDHLEKERDAFPDASLWAYTRRLVGLPA